MPAPVIDWVRPGVGFVPAAAASFQRVEAQIGRRVDANSTYRDYDLQMSWYRAWQRYLAGGPKPNHGKAVHPDASDHCKGRALDTDDWSTLGRVFLENGWRRTDPSENWHWVYFQGNDRYYGQSAGSGNHPYVEDDMFTDQDRANLVSVMAALGAGGLTPENEPQYRTVSKIVSNVEKQVNGLPDALKAIMAQVNGAPEILAQILRAASTTATGSIDVQALATALKGSLGAAVAGELAKRLTN